MQSSSQNKTLTRKDGDLEAVLPYKQRRADYCTAGFALSAGRQHSECGQNCWQGKSWSHTAEQHTTTSWMQLSAQCCAVILPGQCFSHNMLIDDQAYLNTAGHQPDHQRRATCMQRPALMDLSVCPVCASRTTRARILSWPQLHRLY
jgi:hypothetical protein